MRALERKE